MKNSLVEEIRADILSSLNEVWNHTLDDSKVNPQYYTANYRDELYRILDLIQNHVEHMSLERYHEK